MARLHFCQTGLSRALIGAAKLVDVGVILIVTFNNDPRGWTGAGRFGDNWFERVPSNQLINQNELCVSVAPHGGMFFLINRLSNLMKYLHCGIPVDCHSRPGQWSWLERSPRYRSPNRFQLRWCGPWWSPKTKVYPGPGKKQIMEKDDQRSWITFAFDFRGIVRMHRHGCSRKTESPNGSINYSVHTFEKITWF